MLFRLRRPAARLSELAFMFVVGSMVAYGIFYFWPQPALDVSPAWCRPAYAPFEGHPKPPSLERPIR